MQLNRAVEVAYSLEVHWTTGDALLGKVLGGLW